MTNERILITAALPYANGPLHVGHAIGAYIPADVYARYNRLKGNDVVFVGGTDEHGTPIAVAAEKEGVSPQAIVDRYHAAIKQEFIELGISFDNFSRTTNKGHYELSQQFFLDILEKGFIYKKEVERPYCPNCARFLPDRYVRGICPHCGSKDERGDQCEACGKQLEPHELKESYCVICRNPPIMRKTEHWFFKLSFFSERLHDWVEKNRHWPDNARNFSLGWIREGLEDRAITRDLGWGIPVPVEGAKGKVLYVWFDAPIGYITSTKEWAQKVGRPDDWKKFWQDDAKIVHFLGKDNIPFHAIIWPAMLMAHGAYSLPWQISSNEYLTLEGKKMSTSRGWVLWLRDCLDNYDPDVIRYYLLSINPEKKDADFSLKEFQNHVNSELIAAFGNFIHRTLTFIEKNGSQVPKIEGFDSRDEAMQELIREAPHRIGAHIEKFKFLDALKELMALAHAGNEYFQKKEPWKGNNGTTLYICANLCRTLALLSNPFLPYTSEKIWKTLNLEGTPSSISWDDAGELALKEGHRINPVKALYKKIEDEELEAFGKKYLKSGIDKAEVKMDDKIEYDEFKRIELRTGIIKTVEDHPKADKLYILKVDLGPLGVRQIVAGIKSAYKKEELVGKEVIVVANLKPAELRGQTSDGMLLAADVDGKAILLTAEKKTDAGCRIK